MEITFVNPGMDYMIQNMMEFQADDETDYWTGPLYHFYPQLNKEHAKALSFGERRAYFENVLSAAYPAIENAINEKVTLYAKQWEACKPQIVEALSEAFDVDCQALFNDFRCNISMNPVEPRFLKEHSFDIFYLNSEKGAIGDCIHEIIHFVWFYRWNRLFHDRYEEYETPSLKWILSEMVVEPIMRDPRLRSINPYFLREQGGCVYSYFFDMMVDGAPILDTLDGMYQTQDIEEFMKNSYAYCKQHEVEIRNHIRKSETTYRW